MNPSTSTCTASPEENLKRAYEVAEKREGTKALTPCSSLSVRKAFVPAFKSIPNKMVKSLTYDRGTEMAEHKLFTEEAKIQVYFADPYSPWQRGTNENTNGLIRQYFPKKTDFNEVSLTDIRETERRLNSRPRKVLKYYTSSETFYSSTTGHEIALEV